MLTLLLSSALAADTVIAMQIVDPTGTPRLAEEVKVPFDQVFDAQFDGRDYQLTVRARADGEQVRLEAVVSKGLKGKGRPIDARQIVLEAGSAQAVEATYRWKDGAAQVWSVQGVWASVWEAPQRTIEPAPDRLAKSRFALVWDDAWLLADPRKSRAGVREVDLPDGRTDPETQVSPFRIVHTWGNSHYEAETVPTDLEPHCHHGAPPVRSHPYQYYAAKVDMTPVTSRQVEVEHPDGTGVLVAAGVALTETDVAGAYEVAYGGLRFTVALPEDAVGEWYRASGQISVAESEWALAPDAQGALGKLGGAAVRFVGGGPVALQGLTGVDAPTAVVRTPCVELRVRVDTSQVVPR